MEEKESPVASIAQALVDTDSDGIDDGWETTHFGSLSETASGDPDSDGMTNLEEFQHGFVPTVADGFEDADGDRYPNVFEIRGGSDPNASGSMPTPTYIVDGGGTGTHTTVGAAVSAADVINGAYQIIGIRPGTYSGFSNAGVSIFSGKPKLLLLGLSGAHETVIDGGGSYGWSVTTSAVVASLTFRRTNQAFYLFPSGSDEVRLVDLLFHDNGSPTTRGSAVYAGSGKTHIVGSTILNNASDAYGAVYVGGGTTTLANTVAWNDGASPPLYVESWASLAANHSLVKGRTLTGTGNLSGSSDPKLRKDGHIPWDSPLRAAGGNVIQSRLDVDGEPRPVSSPDIGIDQFVDSDADQLPDVWEMAFAGDLTTLTSLSQDADSDGLTNEEEYAHGADPLASDADGDGVLDGDEIADGSDPWNPDTDGDDMPDGWERTHGLSSTIPSAFEDADGDGYPDVFEYVKGTDPTDVSSKPSPDHVVDGSGGGSHTTVSGAVNAADTVNGAYQIIGVAPGVYKGEHVTVEAYKPKLLILGLEGAGKTIIDGRGQLSTGWSIYGSAVLSSLTFQFAERALNLMPAANGEVRLVDLLIRDNGLPTSGGTAVNVLGEKVFIVGSTILNNASNTSGAVRVEGGTTVISNTLIWDDRSTGVLLSSGGTATLVVDHSLVKGQVLPGTGNIDGATNPKLRTDVRLRSDSPLRGAGGSVKQSRIDIDGELRPASGRDIGVDQFKDGDADGLPDAWENAKFGNVTVVTGAADDDNDGLTNLQEYDLETDLHAVDTDGDGMEDAFEVSHGFDPRKVDADDLASDENHDGILDGVGLSLGHSMSSVDFDGDSISNEDELLMCTSVIDPDTDGDGVPDDVDAFPRDPLLHALPVTTGDTTGPIITLTAPWSATPL